MSLRSEAQKLGDSSPQSGAFGWRTKTMWVSEGAENNLGGNAKRLLGAAEEARH